MKCAKQDYYELIEYNEDMLLPITICDLPRCSTDGFAATASDDALLGTSSCLEGGDS